MSQCVCVPLVCGDLQHILKACMSVCMCLHVHASMLAVILLQADGNHPTPSPLATHTTLAVSQWGHSNPNTLANGAAGMFTCSQKAGTIIKYVG